MKVTATAKDRSPQAAQALAEKLAMALTEGAYGPQVPLPTYKELSRRHRVGMTTVRQAFDILEAGGMIVRLGRRATFQRSSHTLPGLTKPRCPIQCINILAHEAMTPPVHQVRRTETMAGITKAADKIHASIRVVLPPPGQWEEILSPCLPPEAQGCILIESLWSAELMNWLNQRGIPFVLLSTKDKDAAGLPPHHRVFADKAVGAAEAARYLLELGHRRIGFIGPVDARRLPFSASVLAGVQSALICEGLSIAEEDQLPISVDTISEAIGPVREYLRRNSRITAVMTSSDAEALAVLAAAAELGRRVPEELSVIGFNGLPEGESSTPPLTTVLQPIRSLAAVAVDLLAEVAAKPQTDDFQTRILPCHLMVRKSTQAPPVQASQPDGRRRLQLGRMG